jgi:hypothetical protein
LRVLRRFLNHPGIYLHMKAKFFTSLTRPEYGIAALLTLGAIVLHVVLWANIGDPWRDEVNSVAVASAPTWSNILDSMPYDSFPVLYFALLRVWTGIFGDATASLRALGLCLGLGGLWATWWLARRLHAGPPLLILAMVAMSAAVIRYGDANRAYGLAFITAALMLGAIWSLLLDCSKKSIALAGIACVAAAHSSYQNSLLLLGIGSAAILASAINRRWRSAACIAAVCATTALTMAIYLPIISFTKSMMVLFPWSISVHDILGVFGETVSNGYGDWQKWIWLAAILVGLTIALLSLFIAIEQPASATRSDAMTRSLFVLLVIPMLMVIYTMFMIWSDYAVRPWYLLGLMLVLAAVIEAGVASLPEPPRAMRIILPALALVIGIPAAANAPTELKRRATNMPELIAAIEREGGPQDLVIITEWYVGLTFNHLYKGNKPWMTIPDMGRHSVHRMDILKARMMDGQGIPRELEQITSTLHSGHRVFVIGNFARLSPQMLRSQLPPAPHPQFGWSSGNYTAYWAAQAGAALSSYASNAQLLQAPASRETTMDWENYPLFVFSRGQ